jgi:hypothetical protein
MVNRDLDFHLLELLESKVEPQLGPNAAGIMESWNQRPPAELGVRVAPGRGRGHLCWWLLIFKKNFRYVIPQSAI